jgi:hypothetical protein
LDYGAKGAGFTDITKNKVFGWYRQAAYNISRDLKILQVATIWGGVERPVDEYRAEHKKIGRS